MSAKRNTETPGAATQPTTGDDPEMLGAVDPKDAEIARLQAELAAARGEVAPSVGLIEIKSERIKQYERESQHLHMTTAELNDAVRKGKTKLTERSVLCKDGWFVNPFYKQDQG